MQVQSGICIELNQDRSIFLMKDGQFVTGTPAGNTSIGEEARFYPLEKKSMIRFRPIMAPVIAAVAALALFLSVLVSPEKEAFGYVQIQINPGVELGVNEQHEVVSIRELNRDGEKLIHQLGKWKDRPLSNILNRVIDLAVTEKTEDITITAVEEDSREIKNSIKKVAAAISSDTDNEEMAIHLKAATKKQWRQSKEKHVPVGKLIKESETLEKEKQPDVKKVEPEADKKPIQKEETNAIEQKEPDQNKKTTSNEINESNTREEKKQPNETNVIPPAVEKKNETKQPQKKPKQNNGAEKSSNQLKNISPDKKKEKVNPQPKAEPKAKPAPKPKEKPEPKKKPAEKIEKRGPENKGQGNNKAPGQQKKNNSPGNSNKPESKKDSHEPPGQTKKNDQSSAKKQNNSPGANGKGNSSKVNKNKGNQGKE